MSDPSRVIADLRKSYERGELDESASHADPLQQFELWMQQALSADITHQRLVGLPGDLGVGLAPLPGRLRLEDAPVAVAAFGVEHGRQACHDRGLIELDDRRGPQPAIEVVVQQRVYIEDERPGAFGVVPRPDAKGKAAKPADQP